MRFNCLLALLFILFFSSAQKNSLPYKNTSLIQVHDISQEVMDSLLKYNVIPFSCRAGVSDSEIIVDGNGAIPTSCNTRSPVSVSKNSPAN